MAPPHQDEITLPADLKNLHAMKHFILDRAAQSGFDEAAAMQIELAADEVLTNVISYAYPDEPGDITIQCQMDKDHVFVVRIMDTGVPFNPLQVKEPDLSLSLEERKIGGLGLFLVHKMTDRVSYHREGDVNILTLYKRKNPQGPFPG